MDDTGRETGGHEPPETHELAGLEPGDDDDAPWEREDLEPERRSHRLCPADHRRLIPRPRAAAPRTTLH